MNILLLRHYNPYVEQGASANRFCGLIDGLCRCGHHVTIGVVDGFQRKDEQSFQSPNQRLDFVYLSNANHYNRIIGRLNAYLFADCYSSLAEKRLKKILEMDYDIIWLINKYSVLNLYDKVRNSIRGKTFIELNEYNDIYIEERRINYLQKRKLKKESEVAMKAIGNIDLIAVMTKTLLSYYQKIAKPQARFMHLPMTVDLSRFTDVTTIANYKKPYIAFTGTMTCHKDGVDVLIKAFAKIAQKYPSFHLYMAGFWHYDVPMLQQLIESLDLKHRVHYIGTLNREQIPPFVCNASVLALSRPDSHQAQGGFPTKLGEYLATGNPVCVTKVGEIPLYLEDNVSAFMAEPSNVDSFADALDRALGDKDNALKVGHRGREVAERHFNVEFQSKRLSDFFENKLIDR